MRPHIKMLTGNYLTFEMKSNQSGGSPQCRLCLSENETLRHLISICGTFEDLRSRIKTSITSICTENKIEIDVKKLTHEQFTQFILDPSSMNLSKRVNINHPALPLLFQQSRDFCYAIDRIREKLIN